MLSVAAPVKALGAPRIPRFLRYYSMGDIGPARLGDEALALTDSGVRSGLDIAQMPF